MGAVDADDEAADAWAALLRFFLDRRQMFVEVASEFELTAGDLHALVTLDPDEPKPMKALAETFRCDPSHATWMVDRLETRGIVERHAMPYDRRVRAVVVTVEGRMLRDRILARLAVPPPEFADLDADDLAGLRCAVAKLTRGLE